MDQRVALSEDAFVEMVVWRLPTPSVGSRHHLKYRLACIVNNQCVLRFDNEAGKGDHYHLDDDQFAYTFTSADQLIEDFWRKVNEYTDY